MNNAQTAYIGCSHCGHAKMLTTTRGKQVDKIFYDFKTTLRGWYDEPCVKCPCCGTPKRFLDEKGKEYRRPGLQLVAVE